MLSFFQIILIPYYLKESNLSKGISLSVAEEREERLLLLSTISQKLVRKPKLDLDLTSQFMINDI